MSVIKKAGAPNRATKGAVGDIYIDVRGRQAYICTSAYRTSTGVVDYTWRTKEEELTEEELAIEETPVEAPVETPKVFEPPVLEETEAPKPLHHNPNQKHNYGQYHKR